MRSRKGIQKCGTKVSLHRQKGGLAYWKTQPYPARLAELWKPDASIISEDMASNLSL